jgi:hypothetical protein
VGREPQDAGHTARSCFVCSRHLQTPSRLPLALFVVVLWVLTFVDVRPAFAALFKSRLQSKSLTRHLNNLIGRR